MGALVAGVLVVVVALGVSLGAGESFVLAGAGSVAGEGLSVGVSVGIMTGCGVTVTTSVGGGTTTGVGAGVCAGAATGLSAALMVEVDVAAGLSS